MAWTYKPLTREEEKALILKAQDGCEESHNRLFEGHFPWWLKACRQYETFTKSSNLHGSERRYTYETDELLSICFMQMRRAVELFDTKREIRFLTFCGSNVWRWFRTYERTEFRPIAFFENDFFDGTKHTEDTTKTVDDKDTDGHRKQVLKKAMRKTLTGRDVVIIEMRYFQDPPATLEQVGEKLGISKERVRQLQTRCFHYLRHQLNNTTEGQRIVTDFLAEASQ